MDNIEKAIKYFKEHLEIFVLIPTLLGGLWQLIELMSIDLAYVRFFSISQVISDGLIILLYIIILYFLPKFYFSKKVLEEDENLEDVSIKEKIFFKVLFVIIVVGGVYALWSFYNLIIKKGLSTISILVFYYISITLIQILFRILTRLIKISKFQYLLIVGVLSSFLILINSKTIFNSFHNLYHIPSPSKFKNIEYLECYLDKKKNEFKFLYSNDKYIFIEDNKSKQIEIINFEELLNKDNCK